MGGVECTVEIGAQDQTPVVRCQFVDRFEDSEPGVVDQAVDPACVLDDPAHGPLDLGLVSHIDDPAEDGARVVDSQLLQCLAY